MCACPCPAPSCHVFLPLLLPLQVRELLNETGQVVALWMPSIKTHCYAVMESQAEATRRVSSSGQWGAPCDGGHCAVGSICGCAVLIGVSRLGRLQLGQQHAAAWLAYCARQPAPHSLLPPGPQTAPLQATYQLQWPATNPKRLAPRFVPLSEAETAIGNGAGNPDFRVKRTEEDAVEEGPPAAAAAAAPAAAAVQAKPAAAAAAAQPAEGPGPDRR